MAASRTLPDPVSNPAGYDPGLWATQARAEAEGLWASVINQTDTVAGTANAITADCVVTLIGAYANGQTFRLTPTANNTTAVTVNIDGKGAKALRQPDGTALVADDLVSGEPIEFWYDSVAGYFRLSDWTQRAVDASALASVTANLLLIELGDTTVSSPVAQVEHSFIAGTYSKILINASGISPATAGGTLTFSLRNAGGAIVSLTSAAPTTWATGPGTIGTNDLMTIEAVFLIDLTSATKYHHGSFVGGGFNGPAGAADLLNSITAVAGSATAPDRIRFAFSSGNIDAGRIITKGLVA